MEQRRLANRESSYFPAGFPPENLSLSPFFYSPRRDSFSESDPINPYGFFRDQNQFLESAFSRLNLSSEFQHQNPPLRPLPAGIDDLARHEAGPLTGYCYSGGYGGQELSNVGLQGGMMGLRNAGQDMGLSGVHPNLMAGQRVLNYGTGPSALRGGGVFVESMCGNDSLSLNAALDDGNHQGVYADGYSFLHSKKYPSGGLNVQFPNVPRAYQNGTSRGNLDGVSNGFLLKNWIFLRPNLGNSEERYDLGEEFESLSLQDLRVRIVSLAKDQNGSRILQEKLDKPNDGDIEIVVSEVLVYAGELMKNQFGSYFFQKLFGVCSEEQRTRFVKAVTENSYNFLAICLNSHGARTMQKLLENLNTPEQISLVMSALCHGVVRLASDSNGQHVVRHCVINYSHEYNKHLLNEVASNCFQIATDKSGCCVLQCCVENAHGEAQERLVKEIITNALHLADDPFGNYVVQHLLSQKIPGVAGRLLAQLQYHFVAMSCDKYASNVVEKFLTESGEEHSTIIIIELLNSPNAAMLLTDAYGNFVIQKALSVSKGYVYQQLSNFIMEHAPSMRSNRFGQKILSWFEKKKSQHLYSCTSKRCH